MIATDDFNRADSNDLGANWTESDWSTTNSIRILSNEVVLGNANGIAYYNGTFTDDQYVQATIKSVETPVGDGAIGLGVRITGNVNAFTGYVAWLHPSGNNLHLVKYNGGLVQDDYTELATVACTVYLGGALNVSLIKLSAVGTTIKLIIDGAEKISVTDASVTSGNPGLVARSSYWQTWDDWEGGDGDGSGSTFVPITTMIL